jgi:hypothetical protein
MNNNVVTISDKYQTSFSGKKRFERNLQAMSKDINERMSEVLEKTKGSLTAIYGNDLSGQFAKIYQKMSIPEDQYNVFFDIVQKLIEIEILQKCTCNIRIEEATDDEIVLSRRTQDGLSLISINPFGDIMVNFSGYTKDNKIIFYEKTNYDPENLVYGFLSL